MRMLDHLIERRGLRGILREKDGLEERDLLFIKEMIAGPIDAETGLPARGVSVTGDGEWPYRGRGEDQAFLYEIIANKSTGE